jgi:hypothetical protein
MLNQILKTLGLNKSFVLFRDFDFGQEYGVAYLDTKKQKKLQDLFRIEILNPLTGLPM